MARFRMIIGVGIMMILSSHIASGQNKPRARDLGVPFEGSAGPLNAITDVKGVEVGHVTLISGEGALKVGSGPVRTGVTAILPRGKQTNDQVFAGMVFPERQRRDDRDDLGRGIGFPRRPGHDNQHSQRRRHARRGHRVAREAQSNESTLVAAHRGRNL